MSLNPIRKGMFTASEFHKLMTCEKNPDTLPAGAMTYVYRKAAETLADWPEEEGYTNAAMQNGILCEPLAVAYFEKKHDIELHFTSDHQETIVDDDVNSPFFGEIAGTPDAVLINFINGTIVSGVEIKCPTIHTHLFNLVHLKDATSLKAHYPEYYWQIYGYMLLTGAESWHFMSYDCRFNNESHHSVDFIIIRNEEELNKLKNRLELAVNAKHNILKQLKVTK